MYALGTSATVAWIANHPDGSRQTAAELEVTNPGGSSTTLEVEGDSKEALVTFDAVGVWKLRCRTHGAHEDWGAWSGFEEVSVAASPVVSITRPSTDTETVDVVPFEVRWEVVDVTGVSSQALRLLDSDGSALYSVELGPDHRSYEFRAGTYLPANLADYTVEVSIRGGSTLTGGARRDFSIDYAEPALPTAEIAYTPELGAEVSVKFGLDGWAVRGFTLVSPEFSAGDGEIPVTSGMDYVPEGTVAIGGVMPTVSASVVRVLPDGSQWLVAGSMKDGETARDPLPPLCTDYKYVVTAFSEMGTSISHRRARKGGGIGARRKLRSCRCSLHTPRVRRRAEPRLRDLHRAHGLRRRRRGWRPADGVHHGLRFGEGLDQREDPRTRRPLAARRARPRACGRLGPRPGWRPRAVRDRGSGSPCPRRGS